MDKQMQQKWSLELQARMRPMTSDEIAAKQASEWPGMRNVDAMRSDADMQNAWTYGDEAQYTNRVDKPEPLPKKPLLQRLGRMVRSLMNEAKERR